MGVISNIDTYRKINEVLGAYDLIVFEGPPTSGKTMLAKRLSKALSRKPVLEPAGRMVSWFHKDRASRAFITQVYFLEHRMTQAREVSRLISNGEKVCQDYAIWKDIVYAKTFLNDRDYRTYYRLYKLLEPAARQPNLLVLLDCSPKVILARIRARKRDGESSLGMQEITRISRNTMSLARKENCPKILIDTTDFGTLSNSKARGQLFTLLINEILRSWG